MEVSGTLLDIVPVDLYPTVLFYTEAEFYPTIFNFSDNFKQAIINELRSGSRTVSSFEITSISSPIATMIHHAISDGNIDFIKSLQDLGYKITLTSSVLNISVSNGQLLMCKFLYDQPPSLWILSLSLWNTNLPTTKYDSLTAEYAIRGNYLDILKWLREKGYNFNGESQNRTYCAIAILHNRLDILKWFSTIPCDKSCKQYHNGYLVDEDTCFYGCDQGNLDIVKFGLEKKCKWGGNCSQFAAMKGHFNILQYVYENNLYWNERTSAAAASRADFDMVKWLNEHGCPWNRYSYFEAITNNDLVIVKYLCENGCPFDTSICMKIAKTGSLDMLILVRKYGCPWNRKTCFKAAEFGHLNILQYAIENGCPFDHRIIRFGRKTLDDAVLRWIELAFTSDITDDMGLKRVKDKIDKNRRVWIEEALTFEIKD